MNVLEKHHSEIHQILLVIEKYLCNSGCSDWQSGQDFTFKAFFSQRRKHFILKWPPRMWAFLEKIARRQWQGRGREELPRSWYFNFSSLFPDVYFPFQSLCLLHLPLPSIFTVIRPHRCSRSHSPVIIDVRGCHCVAKVGAHLEDIRTKKKKKKKQAVSTPHYIDLFLLAHFLSPSLSSPPCSYLLITTPPRSFHILSLVSSPLHFHVFELL